MADGNYGHCEDCGKPLDEDDDFAWRADMISEALEGADADLSEALLTLFVGLHLSKFEAGDRKKARREFIREADNDTKRWVISRCDA